MAVKIRLRRMGQKKAPFYRIIVSDSRSPRDGRFIDLIGTYNPLTNPAEIKIDNEKARQWIKRKKLVFADQSALIRSTTKRKVISQRFNDQKFLHKNTVIRHFSKRLFWLPYPHTDNIKQWHIERVHKVFKYHNFDDILSEYTDLKNKFDRENQSND